MTDLVLREDCGGFSRLTLNDPGSRNSLSLDMIMALRDALTSIQTPVVILAANGPVFCSGHNLKEITAHRNDKDRGAEFYRVLFDACSELMLHLQTLGAAVIAEVNGLASAAGCQLVASCDLAIASQKAGFCTPGVNIGLFCSTPMVAVSRAVERKHAMQMLLTGDVITAEEACRMGLINEVVEEAALREASEALAARIARKSPEAIRIGKKAFLQQQALPVNEAYAAMARVMADNLQCADAMEGIGAFLGKQQPQWPKS